MGFANRAIVAAGLGFAVSALVGCGGSGNLLSAGQASRLSSQLTEAKLALADDQCSRAATAISSFSDSVDSLGSVNQTLVSNLEQGASTITDLAERECPTGSQVRTVPTRTNTRTTPTRTNTRPARTNTSTDTTPTQTYTYTAPTQTYTYTAPTPTDTTPTQTGTDTTPTQTDTDTTPTQTDTDTTPTNTDTTPSGGSGLGGSGTTTTTPPTGGAGTP